MNAALMVDPADTSADSQARCALMLDPGHPGAIHVVTHVMEMQAHARDGAAWLAATEARH